MSRMPAFILARCSAVMLFAPWRFISSSSSSSASACARVRATSCAARSRACSISLAASRSSRSRYSLASSLILRASAFCSCACRRSDSNCWRLCSRFCTTSSNRRFSPETSSRARSTISCFRPRRLEMANAFERPGTPIKRRYVGRRVATSNSQLPFSTPAVCRA